MNGPCVYVRASECLLACHRVAFVLHLLVSSMLRVRVFGVCATFEGGQLWHWPEEGAGVSCLLRCIRNCGVHTGRRAGNFPMRY